MPTNKLNTIFIPSSLVIIFIFIGCDNKQSKVATTSTLTEKNKLTMPYTFIHQTEAQILIKKIKIIATEYFNKILELEKGNKICSFGIASDSDLTVFAFHYNTPEGIEKIKKSALETIKDFPELKERPLDDDKWSVYEWISEDSKSYDIQTGKGYKEVEALMDAQYKRSNWDLDDAKNTFALYKSDMFDIFCEALKEMKNENVFQNTTDDFFLLFQEGDNGIYGKRKGSLKKILSPNQLDEYTEFCNVEY